MKDVKPMTDEDLDELDLLLADRQYTGYNRRFIASLRERLRIKEARLLKAEFDLSIFKNLYKAAKARDLELFLGRLAKPSSTKPDPT